RRPLAVTHPTLGEVGRLAKSGVAPVMAVAVDAADATDLPAGQLQPDDLLGRVTDRPPGTVTICAVGYSQQQLGSAGAPSFEEYGSQMQDLEVTCAQVTADQSVVTLELPPMRRLGPAPKK